MPRLRFFLSLLLLLCGCGTGAKPAHQHYRAHIEPARWDIPVVLYRAHGPTGDARRAVRRGFGRWETALSGILTLREARDSETEHITARFAFIAPGLRDGKLERFVPAYSSPGVMASALIEFDYQLANPARLGDLERFASHAMGHALFAQGRATGGHSPDPSDVMYGSPGVARPSPADIATLRMVYSSSIPHP